MDGRLPEKLTHFETGYRATQGARFELQPGWNLSQEGLAELQVAERNFKGWARMLTPGAGGRAHLASQWAEQGGLEWVCAFKTSAECKRQFDKVMTSHAKAMRSEKTDEGKLRRIAQTCRRLEQAHLFNDGNARTVGFLLLNRLLLNAGMSPALMANPNEFDGFSVRELVQSLRRGQEHFAQYTGRPTSRT